MFCIIIAQGAALGERAARLCVSWKLIATKTTRAHTHTHTQREQRNFNHRTVLTTARTGLKRREREASKKRRCHKIQFVVRRRR